MRLKCGAALSAKGGRGGKRGADGGQGSGAGLHRGQAAGNRPRRRAGDRGCWRVLSRVESSEGGQLIPATGAKRLVRGG